MIYENNEFYQGYFKGGSFGKYGKPNGLGKLSSSTSYYVGEFLDGLEHGYGEKKSNDGSILYRGEWSNGEKWGKGFARITAYNDYIQEDTTCDCEWRNGEIINGRLTYLESGNVFEGLFKEGQPSQGKVLFSNGDSFEGGIFFSELTIFEKMTYSVIDTEILIGTLEKANGVVYKGMFEDGKLTGMGKQLNPDMSIQDGHFYDGEFLGSGKKGEQKYNSILDQEKKIKLEAQEKEQQRIAKENRAKEEKERKEKEKAEERARERQKRANIRNNCIIDLSKEVDMTGSTVERSVRDTCSEIADDPSWYQRWKYE